MTIFCHLSQIDAVVSSTGTILPLVPETTIPIDRSNCPGHNHTHGTMHPDGETTSPDGETTSPDGETTFPDDGTTPAGGGTTPPSNTTGLITSNGMFKESKQCDSLSLLISYTKLALVLFAIF